MNFSADDAARKWSYRGRRAWSIGMPAAVCLLVFGGVAWGKAHVPLPRPRPAEAPKIEAPVDAAQPQSDPAPDKPSQDDAEATQPKAPEPTACRLALTEDVAIAPSIPPIKGPGACGGEDLVRLEAVVLPNAQRVAVKPAAVLRCKMATAIADWIRNDMAPLATSLGTKLSELDNFDSFECRGRNRIKGARLSEHGLANALDVRGLKLANGTTLSLTDRNVPRETREKVLTSVCARFMTVLGPGSDWYHEDHIHLDLAERRNNYKLCQWGVYDPMPVVAPLMPAERPDDAPPRMTAEEKAALEKAAAAEEKATDSGKADEKLAAEKPANDKAGRKKQSK